MYAQPSFTELYTIMRQYGCPERTDRHVEETV